MPILFTLGLEHALVVPFHGPEFVKWSFNLSLHRVGKKKEKKDLSDPPAIFYLPWCLHIKITRAPWIILHQTFQAWVIAVYHTSLCLFASVKRHIWGQFPAARTSAFSPLHPRVGLEGDQGLCFQVEWTQSGWHSKHLTKCREKKKWFRHGGFINGECCLTRNTIIRTRLLDWKSSNRMCTSTTSWMDVWLDGTFPLLEFSSHIRLCLCVFEEGRENSGDWTNPLSDFLQLP